METFKEAITSFLQTVIVPTLVGLVLGIVFFLAQCEKKVNLRNCPLFTPTPAKGKL